MTITINMQFPLRSSSCGSQFGHSLNLIPNGRLINILYIYIYIYIANCVCKSVCIYIYILYIYIYIYIHTHTH